MSGEFNGITIGGKSVESFLTDEHTKDVLDAKEVKHYVKKKGRVRYMDTKEPHGDVKQTAQSALNQTNLDSHLLKAKSLKQNIVYRLIAGEQLSGGALVEIGAASHLTTVGSAFRQLMKSNLKKYFIKEKRGKHNLYYFNEAGVNLKPGVAIAEMNTAPGVDQPTPSQTSWVPQGTNTIADELKIKYDDDKIDVPITGEELQVDGVTVKEVVFNVTVRLKLEVV